MSRPLSHKCPIPISQLCLVNTDVLAVVGAPPLDTTSTILLCTQQGIVGKMAQDVGIVAIYLVWLVFEGSIPTYAFFHSPLQHTNEAMSRYWE